jgi:hypothetical protein
MKLRKGGVGPPWPNDAELSTDPFESARRIAEKIIPVDNGPAHIPRSGLGVQHMSQPDETTEAERDSIPPIERQSDLKRRSQLQNRANGPVGLPKHRRPERRKPAHAGILDDCQAGVSEFPCEG